MDWGPGLYIVIGCVYINSVNVLEWHTFFTFTETLKGKLNVLGRKKFGNKKTYGLLDGVMLHCGERRGPGSHYFSIPVPSND